MKRALSSVLLWVAAVLMRTAVRMSPPVDRVQRIADLPHPQILRPAKEWWPVLEATHPKSEIQCPTVRA